MSNTPKKLTGTKLNIGERCPTCSAPAKKGDDGKGSDTYQSRAIEFIEEALEARKALLDLAYALDRYGDPESYFAVAVIPDRPSGWFANDYDDQDIVPDMGPRHGALARKIIQRHGDLIERLAEKENYDPEMELQ